MADTTTADGESAASKEKPRPQPGQGPEAPYVDAPGRVDQPAKGKKKFPVIWIVAGAVALVGLFFGIRAWIWGKSHVNTDDAYITGDLVNIGPAIQGTLVELKVKEGDTVHKGDLIAVLDDSGPFAAYRQAVASYRAAQSMIPEAKRTLEFQRQATQASIQKAQAALDAQRAKTAGARAQVGLTSATTSNQVSQSRAQVTAARAQQAQSEAQVQSAKAVRANNVQAVVTAQAGLANARQQVTTAERAVQVAQSRVASSSAEATRAARDAARDLTLYQQDAISAQAYDQARAMAEDLAAQVDANRSTVQQMVSQLESARRVAEQSASQVAQAQKTVSQGDAQVKAAQRAADASAEQVRVAQAGVGIALANTGQVGIQQSNLLSSAQETGESAADLATAQANKTQNQLRQEQVSTAEAQAAASENAVRNAKVVLDDCKIYAPTDGMVVRKDANSGQVVAPGTTLVTITKGNHVWVEANYKETQLTNVKAGQKVEIEVDAYPGKVYRGEIESINQATGASTALLPPDNSTGNFTKVVQRISVRIRLLPSEGDNGGDLAALRQGMSVTAVIDTNTQGGDARGSSRPRDGEQGTPHA